MSSRNAPIKWANVDYNERLLITISVCDLTIQEISFNKGIFLLRAINGEGNVYEANFELFGEVNEDSLWVGSTKQKLELKIKKKDALQWPRLTADKLKRTWITADFSSWEDEKEEKKSPDFGDFESTIPYKSLSEYC